MRILIVDDDPDMLQLLSKFLHSWGHETVQARDGQEAWSILQQGEITFVITDWLMPQMDGVTLCKKIRDECCLGYVYVIILTSKETKTDVIEGMTAGADDYVRKPFNKQELKQRVRAGHRILELQSELEEKNDQLSRAYKSIEKDLKVASKVQKSLLPRPSHLLSGVCFETFFQPCTFVAGDVYNYFELDDEQIGFYLLDVSGHGVASALLSVALSKLISPGTLQKNPHRQPESEAQVYDLAEPARIVKFLNDSFQSDIDAFQYFTMVYGIIDLRRSRIRMCQAAHPQPILVRAGEMVRPVEGSGFPVGLFPEVEYEETELNFVAGDRLFIYSDGITECCNPSNVPFAERRLLQLLEKSRQLTTRETLTTIHKELQAWRGKPSFDDDLSILAIERVD
ncbi:MAG: SpoIIE family protein phosphatase [bacterium]